MTGVAWYDISKKGWIRDALILLHIPYTLWHLAYVGIGASLCRAMDWGVLAWTVLAFFLAMGIGAHCLDELNGRPLKTQIPDWILKVGTALAIASAVAIGTIVGIRETIWIIPCIVFGGFIVVAYNLELFHGLFHYDAWFGIAWGAFPVVTAYIAQVHTLHISMLVIALGCFWFSLAQRTLSTQVRFFRRKVIEVEGHYQLRSGENGDWLARPLLKATIIGPPESTLQLLSWTIVAIAVALLLGRI